MIIDKLVIVVFAKRKIFKVKIDKILLKFDYMINWINHSINWKIDISKT